MARPKKGQLTQFMVPIRTASDGSVASTVTESDFNSGATVKFYGVDHGTSAAFTSGTVSKTARLVRSGVFQLTLKGTENNYDEMVLRINKTSIKETVVAWNNTTYDDSDLYSALSDLQSDFQSRVPKAVATNSQLSDLASDLRSYLAGISGALSDVESQLDLVPTVNNSDAISDIFALLSDLDSNFQSRVPKLVATDSALSDARSDIKSAVAAITVALTASDISDIASAVAAATGSMTSDIYSLLSDLNSNFNSRIPKEPAARSQLSDLASDTLSYLAGISGAISDVESQLDLVPTANLSDAVSDILALLSDLDSNFNSRIPKEPAARSQLSDLASDLRSVLTVMSGIQSDIYSLLSAGPEVGASSMSDLRSAITANGMQAAGADPTAVIGVTASYGAKVDWLTAMSRNKLTQTSTSAVLFNDTGTAIASATVSDDATTFTRDEWH